MHRRKHKTPSSARNQLQVDYSFKFSFEGEEQSCEVRLSEVSSSKRLSPYFFDGAKAAKKRKISDLELEEEAGVISYEQVFGGKESGSKSLNRKIEPSSSNLSFSSSIRISPGEIMKRKRIGKGGKYAKLITATSEISIKNGKLTTKLETDLKSSPGIEFFSHPSTSETSSSEYESVPRRRKPRSSSSSYDDDPKHNDIWNVEESQERKQIKEFWLSLSEEERNRLIKEEKEAVLKKMKDQQRHSCSCPVCGKKKIGY
jgi:hypothetical protein